MTSVRVDNVSFTFVCEHCGKVQFKDLNEIEWSNSFYLNPNSQLSKTALVTVSCISCKAIVDVDFR